MAPKTLLKQLYRDSLSLLTDLYELTMAYAYWKCGKEKEEAAFQLFFRKHPFGGSYALFAGAELAIEYIEQFRFEKNDLAYLEGLKNPADEPLFEPAFLDYLANMKWELSVDALEEGTPVFAGEPMLRVEGPIIQAQLMESTMLNLINFQTLIATKASRVRFAAREDHVVEFGMRRAQGIDGAVAASRAAFLGGCNSTSNVLAGKLFGIPVMGTHAHSWVMSFEEEKEAFRSFAKSLPKSCIFLIDTYDSLAGARRAIEVGLELRKEGIELIAVRLDSGDLHELGMEVREILDEGGFEKVKIMATNELTEQILYDLKAKGSPISLWGVGTNLVTAKDQPALDGVYKLCAIKKEGGKWESRLKISDSASKTTNPGRLQLRRYFNEQGATKDLLYDVEIGSGISPGEESGTYEDLLVPMMRGGKAVYTHPPISEMQKRALKELSRLPEGVRQLQNPKAYPVEMEERLHLKKLKIIEEIRSK